MKGDEKQKEEVSKGAKPCRFDDFPRPSILLTKTRLENLKKEISSQKWRKGVYEEIVKANADLWVGREIALPERTGHYHRFFCSDGTKLETPDEKTQKFTTREYKCPACGKVYSGEPYDGGRRWIENRWRYFACRDLALTYAIEGDKRYAKKAAEILLKYADAYPGRHTTHLEGGIVFQSLGESVMMIPLAQAYDLIYDAGVLSEEEKKHIEYDFFWESAEGLVKMGIGGNWGSWHLSAVGAIGLATRHQRFIDYGIQNFQSQIEKQLGSDGLWPESVHTYHFYPLQAFIHFAEACSNMGEDLYNWKAENGNTLKSMFTAPISYMYPDTRLPAINDGWFG
ncbi:alginate lyase family protein, partial [Candidatus Sumerlaeota bacterium]|nr:alginate lyase family protein [Candidatus Sumerlaeota bacterium]